MSCGKKPPANNLQMRVDEHALETMFPTSSTCPRCSRLSSKCCCCTEPCKEPRQPYTSCVSEQTGTKIMESKSLVIRHYFCRHVVCVGIVSSHASQTPEENLQQIEAIKNGVY
eukprot:4943222-Amphidinium_carterae.1